jgi:hypothetical protein
LGGVFLNDGNGQFALHSSIPFSYMSWPADADLDGDVDFVTDRGAVLINDGAGAFTDEAAARLPGLVSEALVLDVDDDGDPDVSAIHGSSRDWFANDGTGYFHRQAERGSLPTFLTATTTAAFDVDGDADDDFITWGVQGLAIQSNLYRQLDVPLLPRPGGNIDVHVHMNDGGSGASRSAVIYCDFAAATPMRVPPFGTWHLPPAALQLGVIAVPAHMATAQFPFPMVPSGMPADIYLQALLMPSADMAAWRLSNLVQRSIVY